MILVIIRMKVLAEKRKELSQTIGSLIGSLRTEKGCRRCDFYRSMEDENELCILEEWDTRENLNSHLKSERFKVLRGAMNLLQEPYEMMLYTVLHPTGTVGSSCRQKGVKHALDHICDSVSSVGAGIGDSYTMGGFIHVLLVIAIVVVLVQVIQGRRRS